MVDEVLSMPGVILILSHMCKFGKVASNQLSDGIIRLSKKPEGIMTNSPEIAFEVDVRCDHAPEAHLPSLHGRSDESRIWAPGFCRAVLRGLRRQLKLDNNTCDDLTDQLYEIDHEWPKLPALEYECGDGYDFPQGYDPELETIPEGGETTVTQEEEILEGGTPTSSAPEPSTADAET